MAHEIETAFFVRKPAWHGLGIVLQDPPTIEDAIHQAGLDWTVSKHPIFRQDGDKYKHIATHCTIVRDSDGKELGVVGKDWTPVQNVDAFRFFDELVTAGMVELEAAGSLRGGQRIWVLAKVKGGRRDVAANDPVDAYLLLYQGHDGTLRIGIQFTATRVVCANTLAIAVEAGKRGHENAIRLRHTPRIAEGLAIAKRAINVGMQSFDLSIEQYRFLTTQKLGDVKLERYVRDVLEVPDYNSDGKNTKPPRAFEDIKRAYEEAPGADLPGSRGTMWGAYNAVTHWVTHVRGRGVDTRLDANWFGSGAAIRARALKLALTSGQTLQ